MTYDEAKALIESFTEIRDFYNISGIVGSDWRAGSWGPVSVEAFRRDALAALDRKFPANRR